MNNKKLINQSSNNEKIMNKPSSNDKKFCQKLRQLEGNDIEGMKKLARQIVSRTYTKIVAEIPTFDRNFVVGLLVHLHAMIAVLSIDPKYTYSKYLFTQLESQIKTKLKKLQQQEAMQKQRKQNQANQREKQKANKNSQKSYSLKQFKLFASQNILQTQLYQFVKNKLNLFGNGSKNSNLVQFSHKHYKSSIYHQQQNQLEQTEQETSLLLEQKLDQIQKDKTIKVSYNGNEKPKNCKND